VGGGVGGLAIAARIAAEASASSSLFPAANNHVLHITILEKNANMGGRCGSFFVPHPQNNSALFRHERGPSLLLLPHIYHELFEDCSSCSSKKKKKKTAQDYGLQMVPCIPAYQAVFDDDGDNCIHVGFPKLHQQPPQINQEEPPLVEMSNLEVASRKKMNALEPPHGAVQWDDYLQTCRAFLNCGLPNFIQQRFHAGSFPAFLYESLRNSARAWPLRPHSDMLYSFFPTSSKLRALASFQDLYVGLEPYRRSDDNNNNNDDDDDDYSHDDDKDEKSRDNDDEKKTDPWWLGLGGGVIDTTAAAVFGLLAAIELHPDDNRCNNNAANKIQCGVYAPLGGFQAVTDAMERLCRDVGSVNMKCQHTVTQVTNRGVYYMDNSSNGTSSTACSANETRNDENVQFEPADLIIVNADLPYAQATLLSSSDKLSSTSSSPSSSPFSSKNDLVNDKNSSHNDHQQQSTIRCPSQQQEKEKATATSTSASAIRYDWNDRDYRFSSGVIAFHWSMNTTLDFLNTHNVYLSASTTERAQQSWQVLRRNTDKEKKRRRRQQGKEQQQDDSNANANEFDDFWRTTSSRHGEDNTNETARAAEEETFPPFNFYVHRPSKTDPSAAPKVSNGCRFPIQERQHTLCCKKLFSLSYRFIVVTMARLFFHKGCDSLLVLVPCPTLLHNPAYANLPKDQAIEKYQNAQFTKPLIDRVRRAVLHRMAATTNNTDGSRCTSVGELRHCILHEVVDTPATYADSWNVGAGTPFGLSHGFGQLSLTRPSSKGTSILSPFQERQPSQHQQQVDSDDAMPNVLYVGASSRPGNGVPLVLIGAKLVAEQAIAQLLLKQEKS
jgi:phytoene dehydrogenase-like protein